MERLSVKEVAEWLQINRNLVIRLVRRGEFGKAVRNGKRSFYLIYREEVEDWLKRNETRMGD